MRIVDRREIQSNCGWGLYKIISETPADTVISIEKNVYHFAYDQAFQRQYPISNTFWQEKRAVNLPIEGKKNIVIDFNGSSLYFHGWTMPIALDGCRSITLKNFTVDWEIPTGAEADVIQANHKEITLSIDSQKYPYRVQDGKLIFTDGIFENECWSMFEFDGQSLLARGETLDRFGSVEFREAGSFVIACGNFSVPAKPGNILLLRHGKRDLAGIYCQNSENIHFENITMYASCGIGFVCQFCKDLSFHDIFTVPNTAVGRRVTSVHDDGIQCSNCRGVVEISGCHFKGLMDDGINIHGTTTMVETVSQRSVGGTFKERSSTGFPRYAQPGDIISFIRQDTLDEVFQATVSDFCLIDRDYFEIHFTEKLPLQLLVGTVMENISNAPQVICEHNFFDSGRARGILISTPYRAVIRKNIFNTSGSAILSSGDANYWFESGACKDLTICDNYFTEHCLSGRYEFCNGVISLCPVIPLPQKSRGFHKNIVIEDNTFVTKNKTLLYDLCSTDIVFKKNKIVRAMDYCGELTETLKLEYCANVHTSENSVIGQES